MDATFLRLLRCPLSGSQLRVAEEGLLGKVNEAILAGRLTNRRGETPPPLDEGLESSEGGWLFAVVNNIPSLVKDEAIDLDQLSADGGDGEKRAGSNQDDEARNRDE